MIEPDYNDIPLYNNVFWSLISESCHILLISPSGTRKIGMLFGIYFGVNVMPSFLEQNQAIERYVEFYNHQRPSSVLGNMTPMAFRGRYNDQLNAAN